MIVVEYWINTADGYDNRYYYSEEPSEELAILDAKDNVRRGKEFKIYSTQP